MGEVLELICDSKDQEIHEITADLLNCVRYLFKHKMYKREQELHLIVQRQSGSGKEDTVNAFRKYIEYPLDMKKATVLLGPSIRNEKKLEQYLIKENVFKEIKSTGA